MFYSIHANTSFCFVLCNEPKFRQLTFVFSLFFRLFLEITSFYTTPRGQIMPCHVTDIKMLRVFALLHIGRWLARVSGILLSTLQSRNVGVKSVSTKVDIREKCTSSCLQEGLSIWQATNSGGMGVRSDLGGGGAMVVPFCEKLPHRLGNNPFHKENEWACGGYSLFTTNYTTLGLSRLC